MARNAANDGFLVPVAVLPGTLRIKVDAAKFDRILKRMLDSPPLSKGEISARIKAKYHAKSKEAAKRYKASRKANKLGQ